MALRGAFATLRARRTIIAPGASVSPRTDDRTTEPLASRATFLGRLTEVSVMLAVTVFASEAPLSLRRSRRRAHAEVLGGAGLFPQRAACLHEIDSLRSPRLVSSMSPRPFGSEASRGGLFGQRPVEVVKASTGHAADLTRAARLARAHRVRPRQRVRTAHRPDRRRGSASSASRAPSSMTILSALHRLRRYRNTGRRDAHDELSLDR